MLIPRSINLGVHTISVVRKDLQPDDAYGIFDTETLTIFLDSRLEGTLLYETFCHELVECLNFFAEADMEHQTIQVFGLLLAQVLKSIKEEREPAGGKPALSQFG